jgi:hypothetical protein
MKKNVLKKILQPRPPAQPKPAWQEQKKPTTAYFVMGSFLILSWPRAISLFYLFAPSSSQKKNLFAPSAAANLHQVNAEKINKMPIRFSSLKN